MHWPKSLATKIKMFNRMHNQIVPPLMGECIDNKSVATKLKLLSRMHTEMATLVVVECTEHNYFRPDHDV